MIKIENLVKYILDNFDSELEGSELILNLDGKLIILELNDFSSIIEFRLITEEDICNQFHLLKKWCIDYFLKEAKDNLRDLNSFRIAQEKEHYEVYNILKNNGYRNISNEMISDFIDKRNQEWKERKEKEQEEYYAWKEEREAWDNFEPDGSSYGSFLSQI